MHAILQHQAPATQRVPNATSGLFATSRLLPEDHTRVVFMACILDLVHESCPAETWKAALALLIT